MPPAPREPVIIDGGDRACVRLLLELRSRIFGLRAGGQGGGGIPRYARAGLRIADVRIRPGDLVLLDNGAANHDRTAFIDPERFDISRPAVSPLSFGHGARYCIGAPLARIELQSVFPSSSRSSRACA